MQRLTDVMAMLAAGIPLTLAIDLIDADGPDSARICRDEQPTQAQLEWLRVA